METLAWVSSIIDPAIAKSAIIERATVALIRTHGHFIIEENGQMDIDQLIFPEQWGPQFGAEVKGTWESGDFQVYVGGSITSRLFGVRFYRPDVMNFLSPTAKPILTTTETKVGRPMSEGWPAWVAEVVNLFFDGTIKPDDAMNAEKLMAAVDKALQERGLEGPSRSTVQSTAGAILKRLRAAEN